MPGLTTAGWVALGLSGALTAKTLLQKKPKTPELPKIPSPPPVIDPTADASKAVTRAKKRNNAGYASTILTGPMAKSNSKPQPKTLLGI